MSTYLHRSNFPVAPQAHGLRPWASTSTLKLVIRQLKQLLHPTQIPRAKPLSEPPLPLLARPVRERIRHHRTARLLLQTIITNLERSVERLVHIARVEEIELLLPMVGPHACQKISLQLQPHGRMVRLHGITAAANLLNLPGIPKQ